jgi:hypothetical protein
MFPHNSVILSGVTAERSEAVTESKDPVPVCSCTGTARHSHHACTKHGEDALTCSRRLRRTWGPSTRGPRASAKPASLRMTDVGFVWRSPINIFVVAFPKMRIPARDGPTKPVILSEVTASRSEAVTESKDPMLAGSEIGAARSSLGPF